MPTDLATAQAALTAALTTVPGAVAVTLTRTNPDTGATISTKTDLTGKRFKSGRDEGAVGDEGGEIGQERVRWRLEASGVAFTVQPRDRITDPDGGVWIVLTVDTACLGRRFVCDCVREK